MKLGRKQKKTPVPPTRKRKPPPPPPIKGYSALEVSSIIPLLRVFLQLRNPTSRREFIKHTSPALVKTFEAVSRNLLGGTFPDKKTGEFTRKHKKFLAQLAANKLPSSRKLKLIQQHGRGFPAALLRVLPIIASTVAHLLNPPQ